MARILIIDDDGLVRTTVQTMLAAGGHDGVLACDGEDGIRQFRAQPFDLVLCDFAMPGKDGLEAIREIREISAAIPIILMTGSHARATGGANLDPNFLQRSSRSGAAKVIAKPFKLDDLLAIVRQCLDASAAGFSKAL